MPQRSVASNYTFEQQRNEINLLAADFWSHQATVTGASSSYLKHDGSNDFTGGTLNVPNAFTINSNSGAGTLTISGNLNVTGTTTTVNTTNLDVTDKNITIAKGNTQDQLADGAGITIDSGTDITWNYVNAKDAWVSSIGLEATTFLKGPYGQFTGSGAPTTGHGVLINAPDANTGQIASYDYTNTAYKQLNLKGSSVGVYTGTTNALAGTFNSTGLTMESGKTIELDDTIVHSGDPDTKIRFPAADQISFETGATEYLKLHRYASVNFVEAGSTAHLSLADNGTNIRGILIGDGNASSTGGLRLQAGGGSSGFGGGIVMYSHANSDNPGGVYIGKSVGATGSIIFGNSGTGNVSAANEFARITSGGSVGIGEVSPDHLLHIKGTTPILAVESHSWVSGVSAAIRLSYTDGDGREIRGHYEKGLMFTTNQGEAMRIDTNGIVNSYFGTTISGTNSATPRFHVTSTNSSPDLRLHTWNDASGMYALLGVNDYLNASGNNAGATADKKSAGIFIDGRQGLIKFRTKHDSGTAASDRITITSTGYVTITDTPTLLIKNTSTAGNGVGGITIGKDYAGTDGCIQINSINSGSDTDHLGIEFKVHPSGSGSAQPDRKMVLDHTGMLVVGEIESTFYGQTPNSGAQLILVGNADAGRPASLNLFGYGNTSNEAHARINFQQQTSGTNGDTTARIEAINRSSGEDASDLAFYTEKSGSDLKKSLVLTTKGEALLYKNASDASIGTATNLSFDSLYLGIGETEGGNNVYRTIGFGYRANTTSEYPASMGCQITDWNGNTKAELVFATRNTTGQADVATERLRIYANGNMKLHSGQFTATNSGASNLTAIRCENTTWDSNAHCRFQIATAANQGADPYIHFDAGGSNMIIGNKWEGTTNNYIVMGPGDSPEGGIVNNGGVRVRGNGRVMMPLVYSTNGNSMNDVQIESDGTLCAGNTSIRAAKKNILSQTDVSWLYDLNPVTFNYRKKTVGDDNKNTYLEEIEEETSYGLIAEEVEAVKKDFCFYDNDNELAGVYYKQLITPLLKALQDQKKEIDDLKAQVATLS